MKPLLLVASQVLLLLFGSIVKADSCPDMYMELGFEPIQEGKIDMKNCGPVWPTDIGSYSFYCEDFQPTFYSGHAVLLEKPFEEPEYYVYVRALCLIEDNEGFFVKVINEPWVIFKDN